MAMTFDQFRATATRSENIGAVLSDDCLEGAAGNVYLGSLYIVDWQDGRHGIAPSNGPTWLLTLGNTETEGDLLTLEAMLFVWALNEGYSL